MKVIYQYQIWLAAIREDNFILLKKETPTFRVFIEREGKAKTAPLSDMEIPIYPSEVKARIGLGWEVISFTDSSIVLGNGITRMVWDRENKKFSQPYESYD